MELIKNFGVDPILLGAQIVNFLIILFVLRKFLYKPVTELLQKRQDAIKDGLKKSIEASLRLEKAVEEEKNILRNAKDAAKIIIDDARNEALETAKKVEDIGRSKTEKILKDTKDQITKEIAETEKRLTLNISKLSIEFLKKSLEQLFSENDQKEILKKALKNIK